MKAIVLDDFIADLTSLPFFTDPADNANQLLSQYNTNLDAVINRHYA